MYVQAMCCTLVLIVSFLCSVFIMSQASATTATSTTPPVTVVCSGTSSFLRTVTMVPTLIGQPVTSGQPDVVLPPLLMPRVTRNVIGLGTVSQQQLQSKMPFQAYANYAMGPPLIILYFTVEHCSNLLKCMLSAFRCHAGCCLHQWGSTIGVAPLPPFGAYSWQAYVQPGDGHQPMPGMHQVAPPSSALSSGEPSAT